MSIIYGKICPYPAKDLKLKYRIIIIKIVTVTIVIATFFPCVSLACSCAIFFPVLRFCRGLLDIIDYHL